MRQMRDMWYRVIGRSRRPKRYQVGVVALLLAAGLPFAPAPHASTGRPSDARATAANVPSAGWGYRLPAADGGVFAFEAPFSGSMGGVRLNRPVVGMASDPLSGGYWLTASDGGIFAFGGARFFGSTGSMRLNSPIVGMASSTDGLGYWLVGRDGGVFAFGGARFHGSMGGARLNRPVVAVAADPNTGGYWLVASDGGIFAFGGARFFGSTASIPLNSPIVGMAPAQDGLGYWLVAADGGVFAFGSAAFHGSMGGNRLNRPVVAMAADPLSNGYWLTASDGGIFAFGGARFVGSTGGITLHAPIVGMAAGVEPMAPNFPAITDTVHAVPRPVTSVVRQDAATASLSAPQGLSTVALQSGTDLPSIGEPLVVPTSAAVPTGLLGNVTEMRPADGGTQVTTTPTDAQSAYSEMDVSVRQATGSYAPAFADEGAVSAALNIASFNVAMFKCDVGAGPKISGLLDLTNVHTEFYFSPYGPAISFLLVATPKLQFSVGFSGRATCTFEGSAGAPIVLSVSPPIALQLGTKLEFQVAGSLAATYEAAPRLVFGFTRGAHGNSDAQSLRWNSSADITTTATASALAGITAYVSLGGVVGVEATFGPKLTFNRVPCPGGHRTTGTVSLAVAAAVKINAWVKNWSFTIARLAFWEKEFYSGPCSASGGGGSTSPPNGGGGGGGGGSSGGFVPPPASVRLAQGPAAPVGYRYAISVSGFPGGSRVTISCHDSVDPGGFYTFSMLTDPSGSASTSSQCYSGDGPDHWVIANGGIESNHVAWGSGGTSPSSSVTLAVGSSAQGQPGCSTSACAYMKVTYSNFGAGSHSVVCRASGGNEGGFYTYSTSSTTTSVCYYGFPGRQVWVTVDGIQSNVVTWPSSTTSSPPPPGPSVSLSKGASAQGRPGCSTSACAYMTVTYSNFGAGSHTVVCRASGGDEGGFFTYSTSSTTSSVCYYGFPGRQVWVTVDGVQSNVLTW